MSWFTALVRKLSPQQHGSSAPSRTPDQAPSWYQHHHAEAQKLFWALPQGSSLPSSPRSARSGPGSISSAGSNAGSPPPSRTASPWSSPASRRAQASASPSLTASAGPERLAGDARLTTLSPQTLMSRAPDKPAEQLQWARNLVSARVGLIVDLTALSSGQQPHDREWDLPSPGPGPSGLPPSTSPSAARALPAAEFHSSLWDAIPAPRQEVRRSELTVTLPPTAPSTTPDGHRFTRLQMTRPRLHVPDTIAPDTAVALAAYCLKYQAEHPDRTVLLMCKDGRGPSAQLAGAMTLCERYRDGHLHAGNPSAEVLEAAVSLRERTQQPMLKTLPSLVALCAVGEQLLTQPSHDLATRLAAPPMKPAKPLPPPKPIRRSPPSAKATSPDGALPPPELRDRDVVARLRATPRPRALFAPSHSGDTGQPPLKPLRSPEKTSLDAAPTMHRWASVDDLRPKTRRAPPVPDTPPRRTPLI